MCVGDQSDGECIVHCTPPPTWKEQTNANLKAIQKNCRGSCDDDRVEKAIQNLRFERWDAMLLSESWRKEERERWSAADGHLFCAAGHDTERRGDKGVAIILHKRTASKLIRCVAISERLMYVHLQGVMGTKLRIISTNFPDST